MKIRESGMPEQEMWEKFFDPRKILKMLGLNNQINNVAEFGCGYGTFTIPAAEIIRGRIYAFDIESDMVRITSDKAKKHGLGNVQVVVKDFMADGTGLEEKSVDYVMLFNILHLEKSEILLKEARRILSKAGQLGMIHWNYDPSTPRGPSMDIRPKPQQCIQWAMAVGFRDPVQFDLKPYHYGVVMAKKG